MEDKKVKDIDEKVAYYAAIGWGLIVAFGMVGVLMGKIEGAYIAIVASFMWTQVRIITEAINAVKSLKQRKG